MIKKENIGKTGATLLAPAVLLVLILSCGCGRSQKIEVTGISELDWSPDAEETAGADEDSGNRKGPEDSGTKASYRSTTDQSTADRSSTDQSRIDQGTSGRSTADPTIAVYVRGAVMKPGVYYLPDSSRVYQAIEAAGGFRADADTEWLNQAELLSDGEMLTVSTREETAAMKEAGQSAGGETFPQSGVSPAGQQGKSSAGAGSSKAGTSVSGGLVNINSASKEELMTLPGIGESKAESIIRYREENGPFASPEDIMNISGIKNSVYGKIQNRITV